MRITERNNSFFVVPCTPIPDFDDIEALGHKQFADTACDLGETARIQDLNFTGNRMYLFFDRNFILAGQ